MLKFGAFGLLFLGYVLVRYFLSIKKTISNAPTQMKFLLMGTAASMIGILPIVLTNNVIGAVQGNVFVSFIFGLAIFAERQMMENGLEQNGEEDVDA